MSATSSYLNAPPCTLEEVLRARGEQPKAAAAINSRRALLLAGEAGTRPITDKENSR